MKVPNLRSVSRLSLSVRMAVGQIFIENAVFAGVDDHEFNLEILSKKKDEPRFNTKQSILMAEHEPDDSTSKDHPDKLRKSPLVAVDPRSE